MEEIAYQYCQYYKDALLLHTKEMLYNQCMIPIAEYIKQLIYIQHPEIANLQQQGQEPSVQSQPHTEHIEHVEGV